VEQLAAKLTEVEFGKVKRMIAMKGLRDEEEEPKGPRLGGGRGRERGQKRVSG